jgi:anti-sigma B factor antagonist
LQRAIETLVDSSGDTVVLGVAGELDIATVPEFNRAVMDALRSVGNGRLVVDLLHVTFLDSSGLGALVSVKHEHPYLDLTLVIGGGIVRKTVTTTGLDQWFNIADTVEQAVDEATA